MLTKPIAVAGIAVAAIAAAGIGSYVAVRQNSGRSPQIEVGAANIAPPLSSVEPTRLGDPAALAPLAPIAVEATEAVVGLEPSVAEAPQPAPRPETPPERPVAEAAPVPTRTPAPTPRAAPKPLAPPAPAPAPEPMPRPAQPATVPVTEHTAAAAPLEPAPVQPPATAVAATELPPVEGWARADGALRSPRVAVGRQPLPSTAIFDDRTTELGVNSEPLPSFVELEIAADSVIGLQVDTAVSTRTAQVEDPVEARVTRDVQVADQVAVPAGTRMLGSVVLVEQGGRLRDASRLGVRFHTLVMDDGAQVTVVTETIYREGKAQGSDSVAKIGGAAVGGAILGAIFGGSRGAAIGGSIGAAGGTAAALNGESDPAGLPPGSRLTVRLSRPAMVTIAR